MNKLPAQVHANTKWQTGKCESLPQVVGNDIIRMTLSEGPFFQSWKCKLQEMLSTGAE